jgi:glycosyltransferase involved in cell wall biosynthesis
MIPKKLPGLNVDDELDRINKMKDLLNNKSEIKNEKVITPSVRYSYKQGDRKWAKTLKGAPKISIIVPVYMTEKYLRKCVNSLIDQTLGDIEILLINNKTRDNSQDIIDDYVRKYPEKVKSYYQGSQGLGNTRNLGLKKATGDFIMFVDSDDSLASPMTCENLYKFAIENDCDIVIGRIVYEIDGKIQPIPGFDRKYSKYYGRTDLRVNDVTAFGSAPVTNKLFQRSLMVNNGLSFPKNSYYEDTLISIQLWYISKKIGCIEDTVYHYFQRNNPDNPSITNQGVSFKHVHDRIYGALSIVRYLSKNEYYSINGINYLEWYMRSTDEMLEKFHQGNDKEKALRLMSSKGRKVKSLIQAYKKTTMEKI